MSAKKHWYVRRNGELKGPFLSSHIRQNILLGRVREDDQLSQDQQDWQLVSEHRELYPEVMLEEPRNEERIQAERMKQDERSRDRRGSKAKQESSERRISNDRRQQEAEDIVSFRETHHRVMESLTPEQATPQKNRLLIYIILFIGLLSIFSFQFQGGFQFEMDADCELSAMPGINWRYCDKSDHDLMNIDLSDANLHSSNFTRSNLLAAKFVGSDLSYANLAQANLSHTDMTNARVKGANLSHADLSYADLSHSDLSFVNLTAANLGGAILEQARLDQAIWIDGSVCAKGSIGQCILQ